ncbi:MAG: glycosyltransferase [Candidatus Moranbacteria bacterium]|nr:glycosyltransferase [Candidatus Moranbacteria bacterium]
MDKRYIKGRIKRFFGKYWGLGRLAFWEFYYNSWGGMIFAIKRHYKKRRGEIFSDYPRSDDFEKGLVTIGILTKNRLDLIRPCLESIENNLSSKYKIEILLGDTGSTDKNVLSFYKEARKDWKNIQVIWLKKYFFSKNYNEMFGRHAKGQYLVFLNNDTIVKQGWIDALADSLKDKKIGIVGGKLLHKNGTIQHAGIEINPPTKTGINTYCDEPGDIPEANIKAIVPAVTFACAAIRHDVFNRFRMNENFREEAQDTDFCFRLAESGFSVLYNPEAEIFHFEGSSRDWRKGEKDRWLLKKIWGNKINDLATKIKQRIAFGPNEYKNAITVIRDDGIGDLLMGMSIFSNLRRKYPGKKLILATYERNIEMMAGFGIFDEFVPIPNGQKYAPLPIPSDSKVYNFIDLEMDVTPISGTPKEDNKINRHLVYARNMELDEKFDLVPMPDYPEARKKIEKLFFEMGLNMSQPFVVFNLIASNPARSWWGPYYPKLIEAVEKMGFIPLILGTKDSEYYKGEKVVNLVGKTKTITEFIEALKFGKYVISTDTSASHIAALAGIPFLSIFTGGVKPESRLGFYEKYEVLEPLASLKCYPCWDEGCKDLSVRWKKDPCRLAIKPEEAVEKFKKLVKKYPR